MSLGLVHFVHGKESGPAGSKIAALAQVARRRGWDVASLDYSHTMDPALRRDQLRAACRGLEQPLVLVAKARPEGSRGLAATRPVAQPATMAASQQAQGGNA
jgi:hypothetical protein